MFFINSVQKFKYQPGDIKVSDMYSTMKYVAKPVAELCLGCNLVYHDTISFGALSPAPPRNLVPPSSLPS
jgi:hypothetical protein